jgi:hypothetical protein
MTTTQTVILLIEVGIIALAALVTLFAGIRR